MRDEGEWGLGRPDKKEKMMMTAPFRTLSLALAAGGLTIAAPASAVTATHSVGAQQAVAVYGETTAGYGDRWDRGNHRGWDKQGRNDRRYEQQRRYEQSRYDNNYRGQTWRGDDGRYYCRKSNGTTGLIVGGAAGALLGREIAGRGDRTLGTILGAAGGALLGKSIDSKVRCN